MASSTSERAGEVGGTPRPDRLGAAALVAIGALTFVVALLAIDARATYGARVTADEPQYLTTALSLAEDADLDIGDELADRRYLPYHEIPLNPQTIDLDGRGQRLSPHDPLLPVALAPAMGLGGWAAAKATIAALAGLTAAATAWVANRRLDIGAGTSAIVVLGLFLTPPLTTYGTQVYPEMPAALAVVAGVAGLLGDVDPLAPDARGRRRLVVAAVIALPWLSVKYVPVAAVLASALLWPGRHADRRRRAIATAIVLAAAGVAYLVAHRRIYGGWTVYAAGDHFVDGEFGVVGTDPDYGGRSRRLIGLLVDRSFGLAPWSPAYLLLAPALGALARDRGRRRPRALLGPLLAVGWAMATWVALTMHGWWWPGRQVVVVLPVAVLAIAALVDDRPRLRPAVVVAAGIALVDWLWLVVEASTGRRTLIVDFFETAAPAYRLAAPLFPDHLAGTRTDGVVTAVWVVALAGAAIAGWRTGPRPGQRRGSSEAGSAGGADGGVAVDQRGYLLPVATASDDPIPAAREPRTPTAPRPVESE